MTNYHSWTHRPKSQGGTDPIPSLAMWPVKVCRDDIAVSSAPSFYWMIPEDLDAHELMKVEAFVSTPGSGDTVVQIHHVQNDVDVLSTPITIASGDLNSKDAGTQPVVDLDENVVEHGDHYRIDIDSAGGGATGLGVYFYFLAGPDAVAVVRGPAGQDGASSADQVSYDNGSSGLDADNAQDAIDELAAQGGGSADEVTYDNSTSGLAADDVQAAIDELAAESGGSADQVTYNSYVSGLVADTVQEALDQVASGFLPHTRYAWLPLTTVVDSEPVLVWDADDSLVPTLVHIGDFSQPAPPELTVFEVAAAPHGGACWFQDPRAVYVPGMGDVVFGYVDNSGHIRVRAIDDESLSVSSSVVLATPEVDDHDNPAFLRRSSDNKIIAMYTTHVGNVYQSVASSPNDIASLPSGSDITSEFGGRSGANGFTYAHLFELLGEASDPMMFTVRYHSTDGVTYVGMARSYDNGINWEELGGSANNVSLLAQVTYHKVAQNGSARLDFAVSNHPDDTSSPYNVHGIYHFYYQAGNLYKTDGTLIGPVGSGGNPGGSYDYSELTEVDDAASGICWIWDIAINPITGRPVIVYVVYEPTYPTGRWHYEYAHWTGTAWEHFEIADAGTKFASTTDLAIGRQYAGGVVLDQQDPRIVYFSSNDGTTFHEIYRAFVLSSSSITIEAITESSTEMQIRPVPVHGSQNVKVLWNNGAYQDYFTWNLGTRGATA